MRISQSKQNGFTLLEVLVAFSIMALTFATVMQIIAGSAKNTVRASHETKVAMYAQSKMDELGLFELIEEGGSNGEFEENIHWNMEITPFDVPYEGDFNQDFSAVELMHIMLVVTANLGNKDIKTEFVTLRAITPDFSKAR